MDSPAPEWPRGLQQLPGKHEAVVQLRAIKEGLEPGCPVRHVAALTKH